MEQSPSFSEIDLGQIKLLVCDIDGVLTDGSLYYGPRGEVSKKFNVKDGLGLKRLMAAGIQVAWISSSEAVATVHRAEDLGISHVLIGVTDKVAQLKGLSQKLDIDVADIAYMGDDLVDLDVMRLVGIPIAVANAVPEVLACAQLITEKNGGDGAVREICDQILREQLNE
ncbi:MAG: HAD-IIIA family hydrolase [Cyanobacteria bacterium P01_H01_bin.15]